MSGSNGNPLDFNSLIQLIVDGEPVSAGVPNRPISQLDGRTRYLFDLVRAAMLGAAVVIPQATVEPDANVGQPVYFNAATARFERALAGVTLTAAGTPEPSDASLIWGVVQRKLNSTLADLLVFGYAKLDLSAAVEAGQSATAAGQLYLSRTTAGLLTRIRPPIPVPVLRSDGAGNVFVNPQWVDLAGQHVHLHFRLEPVPAGTHHPAAPGGRHSITNGNVHVRGWLPADDPSFGGKAPHDAKFGYNLAADPSLRDAWPPLPPENAVLFRDGSRVDDSDGGLIVFDHNGIWWMSDCYGDVPFPDATETAYSAVSESAEVSESYNACPHPYEMQLDLYFSQVTFLTDETVVTSLASLDQRLKVECEGRPGTAAHVGPLVLSLDLSFLQDDVDPGGDLAVKSFDPAIQTLHRGLVATGLYAKNAHVVLAGTSTTLEQVDPLPAAKTTVYHGRVGVDIATGADRELFPDLVRLDGATEEFFQDVLYLSLGETGEPSLRVRVPVPATLDATNPQLTLRLRVFGRAAGTLPDLVVTYRRIPASATPAALPLVDSPVTVTTAVTLGSTNEYADVDATPFAVAAGDDVLLTITRALPDGYAGEMGLLRITGLVSAA